MILNSDEEWITLRKFQVLQDGHVFHPWSHLTFQQIEEEVKKFREEYPDYSDLRLQKEFKSFGFGAFNTWYELQGKIK